MTAIPIHTLSPVLSPTRAVLCSRAHAIRVAARMRRDGMTVTVVATLDPLQLWRVIEHGSAATQVTGTNAGPEAARREHAVCA